MASRKRKPAIELIGEEYNRLKAFYRVGNNDLSGENPTTGKQEFRHGIGYVASKGGRGRIAQRAITQRKNQQRKNAKKGAK